MFLTAANLAKMSFFLYLFFAFFGTSMPFQERISDVEDISTSNPVNQVLFSSLFIISSIALIPKRRQVLEVIGREKFLSLFLFWCFLSILWSEMPFVSFKRLIRIFGTAIVFLSGLLHFRTVEDSAGYFRTVLIAYVTLTFMSILFIPGAIQWEFPAWRGLASHKNVLGQVSLVSLIFWSYSIFRKESGKNKMMIAFWILSLILLIGSRSITSFLTGMSLLFLIGLFYAEKRMVRPVAGKFISSLLGSFFFIGLLFIFCVDNSILASIFHLFGKDLTFSGRVDLWTSVFEEAKKHLLVGSGFEGFWVVNTPTMDRIFEEHVWLPNQSHLGYLDILNETGIVGIMLLACMVARYFRNVSRIGNSGLWKWFVIAGLITNLTESTLFRLHHITGVLFTFSYLALYADLIRRKQNLAKIG